MNLKALKARAGAFFASRYVLVLSVMLVIPFIMVHKADNACAGPATIAPTPCDPQYYESLENRAWLEAQREITQNQNLIFKPDSVLSYTCFEQYMGVLANQTQNMFSESIRWGNAILGTDQDTSMDQALVNLVILSLGQYLDLNFHGSTTNTLGGRPEGPPRSDPTSTHGTVPLPNNYNCQLMNQVWMQAKCYNFTAQPNDGFFTFENYDADPDKRMFPTACTSKPDFGVPMQVAGLDPGTPPPWPADDTVTYFNLLNAATSCSASVLIPTGITVNRPLQTPNTYQERACSQAGCHFNATTSTCVP